MRSSFFEFNVATTALHTARMGLSVTNHNTANAATKGYSRQYAQIRAGSPLRLSNGRGMIGTGSEVYGVSQIRDLYLDKKYWKENCVLGEYSTKQQQLNYIENIFNGLADTGLNATIDRLFASIQELSQNSGDGTFRTNMIRACDSLAEQINQLAKSLKSQQTDTNTEIRATVEVVNGLGQQIRNLNEQIQRLEMDGSQANDLRDARANLLDELSKYVNIETKEIVRNETTGVKEFVVLLNGYSFVDNFDINPLMVQQRAEKLNPMDAADLYDIYFSNTRQKFDIYHPALKGELKGLIDARDGNNGNHFTKTANSTVTVGAGNMKITNPSRADLNQTGIVRITDPDNGVVSEHKYSGFVYDEGNAAAVPPVPPSVTFSFDAVNQPPAYAANPNATITVGKTDNYKGVPHYMDKLNLLVRTLARAFNEGTTLDGTNIDGAYGNMDGVDAYGNAGEPLFTYQNSGGVIPAGIGYYYNINCENFQVNPNIKSDPKKIAAALNNESDESENLVLFGMINLNSTNRLFAEGKISDYLIGITGELGIDLKQAVNFSLNYTDVTVSIDIQRKSVSGVDISEETINMVKYEQMYTAAAKLINIIDAIYDTTINRLGNF